MIYLARLVFIFFLTLTYCSTYALDVEQLNQLVTEELKKKLKYDNIKITLSSHNNIGKAQDIVLQTVTTQDNKKFVADVVLGNKRYLLHGEYYKLVAIPVAAGKIEKGEVVTKEKVVSENVNVDDVPKSALTDTSGIAGMVAKKNIAVNSLFKKNDLKKFVLVHKGDIVTVRYRSNNLEIKTVGTVLNSGGVSELVKVKIEDSGKVVIGKVVNESLIEVFQQN